MNRTASPILSAEALHVNLCSQLPVFVSAATIKNYPQFSQLLEDLTHHLTPNGCSKEIQSDLSAATASLKHVRQRYMEQATLHHLLWDILHKSHEDKIMLEVREALSLSELKDHIQLLSSDRESSCFSDGALFGLSSTSLIARKDVLLTKKHFTTIAGALEHLLEAEWSKILGFLNPDDCPTYNSEKLKETCRKVEQMKQNISLEQSKLAQSQLQNYILLKQVYGQLIEYGSTLQKLVTSNRLSQQPARHSDNMAVSLEAQCLKLRCIEGALKNSTYNTTTVPALRMVSKQLDQKTAAAKSSLVKLRHQLSAYSGLDAEYLTLLDEYSKVSKDIEFCNQL